MSPSLRDRQPPYEDSWLALVAQTAGVSRCAIARIRIEAQGLRGPLSLVIRIRNLDGSSLGQTSWHGAGHDLEDGVHVDLGFCDASDGPVEVAAWVDESTSEGPRCAAPSAKARVEMGTGKCKARLRLSPGDRDEMRAA